MKYKILFLLVLILLLNSFIVIQCHDNRHSNNKNDDDDDDDKEDKNNIIKEKSLLDQDTLDALLKLTEDVIIKDKENKNKNNINSDDDDDNNEKITQVQNQFNSFVEKFETDKNGNLIINIVPVDKTQQFQIKESTQKQQQKKEATLKKNQQFIINTNTFSNNDYLFGEENSIIEKKSKTLEDRELPGRELLIEAQKYRGYLLYDPKISKTHRYSNSIMIHNLDQSPSRDLFEFVGETQITQLNPEKAIQLLLESSNLGNHRAMYLLGIMNEIGENNNGFMNFTKAEEWYLKSAEYGNSDAQRSLGFLYSTGKLGYIDEAKAILYYTFSAQSGNIISQLTMAYRYLYGHGVEKNCKKSSILYSKVAEKVLEDYEHRGFGYNIQSARLSEEYQKKATGYSSDESDILEFFRYSAEMGDVASLITMARLSLEGSLMTQDFRQALDYFKQAIEEGEIDHTTMAAEGYAGLGFMYSKGYGVEKDDKIAFDYYTKAYKNGDRDSRWRLAEFYLSGIGGVRKDTTRALELLDTISHEMIVHDEDGNPIKLPPVNEALCLLGKIYAYGLGGQVIDRVKASHYFSRAIAGGDLESNFHFARIHLENDESTCPLVVLHFKKVSEKGAWAMLLSTSQDLYDESDTNRALLLSEKAAEMGIEMAQYNAAWMYDKRYGISEYYKSDEEIQELQDKESHIKNDQDKTSIYINDAFNQEFFTQQAFRLFYYSAEQQNALSHIKIGDYFYFGIGVEENLESAAESYQIAANLYHPQGLFNLGYLYQWGLGVPQDLFLAKRYYDMSLTIKPEQNKQQQDGYYGYIPVYLSLTGLLFHFIYLYIYSFFDPSITISSSSFLNNNIGGTGTSNSDIIQPIIDSTTTTGVGGAGSSSTTGYINEIKFILDNEIIQTLETYLIVAFVVIIGYLVIRRQGIILRQRNGRIPHGHIQQPPQQ